MEATKLIIKDVLAKKELSNLDAGFVKQKIKFFLDNNKRIREKFKEKDYFRFKRSKEYKQLLKSVRSELREIYGVFILKGYNKLSGLLKVLKTNSSIENHNKILALHKSSKERLPYHGLVYKKIFEITGKPKRIVDFACGLNPFSYPYLGCKPEYLACDLAKKDLEFVKTYFDFMKIKGTVKRIDLVKEDISGFVKKDDVVFFLKTFDSVESVKKNRTKDLLSKLKAKFVVVSFSTMSIGGKKSIKKEKRAWFEKLIRRLGYDFQTFEIPSEIVYIILMQTQ